MKYLVPLFLIISCTNQQKEYELSSPGFFLGFKFRMTESEYNQHIEKHLRDDKMYINDFGNRVYLMKHKYGSAEMMFMPIFNEGKLDKLQLTAISTNPVIDSDNLQFGIIHYYLKQYPTAKMDTAGWYDFTITTNEFKMEFNTVLDEAKILYSELPQK